MGRIRKSPHLINSLYSSQFLQPAQHIQALHFEVVQQVDEDPVLRQLVALTPVYVDNAHIGTDFIARQAKETTGRRIGEISPAEKACVVALCKPRDVTVELFVFYVPPEWILVLLLVTRNGKSRTYACRPIPDHVVVPCFGQ